MAAPIRFHPNSLVNSRRTRKLSHEQRRQIAARYGAGEESAPLAKEFGVSKGAITYAASCFNIPTNRTSRKKILDERCFAQVTEDSAYWIGFLMADGCISRKVYVQLSLDRIDKKHVYKFRDFLKSNHKIGEYTQTPKDGSAQRHPVVLTVHSKRMVSDLKIFGIEERKTFSAIAKNGIEDNHHFWRGMIDGDGSLGMYSDSRYKKKSRFPQISLCGTKELMQQFIDFLRKNGCETSIKPRRGDNLHHICFSHHKAVAIIKLLYGDAATYLDRKYEKAHEILRWHEALKSETDSKKLSRP